MSQKRALEHLAACVKRGTNHLWHGSVGLSTLRPGADPRLVERAMKIVLPWSPSSCLGKLPDEYAPIAWRVLATSEHAEATFLALYDPDHTGEGLRSGTRWLAQAHIVDAKRNRHRIPVLCRDKAGLSAARATVVEHGVALPRLLAILAHDGAPDSIDALVEVIHHATIAWDESLDALFEWFVPFARGSGMIALAEELVRTRDARGEASSVQELAARFGVAGKTRFSFALSIESRQAQRNRLRKVRAHVELSSHALPNVDLMISRQLWNDATTWWQDGKMQCDDNELGNPSSLDDLPRWLAASARTLKVTWDRETLLVQSSLRGKARKAAIEWLLGGA